MISVRQAARLLLPYSRRDDHLAMLAAYFDDSGTHEGSRVVAMAGWCGTEAQWEAFEVAWAGKLQEPLPGKPPLTKFGLADCVNGVEEFFGYSDAERDAVRYDFRNIIIGCRLSGIAVVAARDAYDEIITGDIRDAIGDAEHNCFVRCVIRAVEWSERFPDDRFLALVFDKGREDDRLWESARQIQNLYKENPNIGFGFLPVSQFTPLQAADMLATEAYWRALQSLNDAPGTNAGPHFRHLLSEMNAEGWVIDREDAIKAVREWRSKNSTNGG
jgi:hypothetical protein